MRLNQYIAHHSKFSRREAAQLIKEGKVSINKEIIKDFSYQVDNRTKVYVNGKCLREKEEYTVIVYNKPNVHITSIIIGNERTYTEIRTTYDAK